MTNNDHTGRIDTSAGHRTDELNERLDTSTERRGNVDDILGVELPDGVQVRLGRLLGTEPVGSLSVWVAELHRHLDGDSITPDDLCLAAEETDHRGTLDGETYHFRCFYDAVVLSALADEPVEVRTVSPNGSVVTASAIGTEDLRVTPTGAVFSFGVAEGVEPPVDGDPAPADVYDAICPYVRAFPDEIAYERWAKRVPAATVAFPLAGATEFASALVA